MSSCEKVITIGVSQRELKRRKNRGSLHSRYYDEAWQQKREVPKRKEKEKNTETTRGCDRWVDPVTRAEILACCARSGGPHQGSKTRGQNPLLNLAKKTEKQKG